MLRVTCTNCRLPFILNREALQAALDEVHREGYKHYNVYCSNCGRQNKVSRKQLRRSAPWWKPSTGAKAAPVKRASSAAKKQATPAKKKPAPAKSKSKPAAKAKPKQAAQKPKAKTPAQAKKKVPAKAKAKPKSPAKAKSKPKAPAKKSPAKKKK